MIVHSVDPRLNRRVDQNKQPTDTHTAVAFGGSPPDEPMLLKSITKVGIQQMLWSSIIKINVLEVRRNPLFVSRKTRRTVMAWTETASERTRKTWSLAARKT